MSQIKRVSLDMENKVSHISHFVKSCFNAMSRLSNVYFSLQMNPWDVENLQDFYFLCCPECVYRTKEENEFTTHCVNLHPNSMRFFSKDSNVKNEPSEPLDSMDYFDNEIIEDEKKFYNEDIEDIKNNDNFLDESNNVNEDCNATVR